MEGLVNIFAFCVYFGILVLCVLLIIYRILKWKNESHTDKRLNILSGVAFVILLIMFSRYYVNHFTEAYGEEILVKQNDSRISESDLFLGAGKISVSSLMYVIIFASAILLLLAVIICIYYGFRTIIFGKSKTGGQANDKSETRKQTYAEFFDAIQQPIVIFVIALGVLSFFFIFPILVGEQKGNLIDTWIDGTEKICKLVDASEESEAGSELGSETESSENAAAKDDKKLNTLIIYILLYIIVLGVGVSVVKLLFSVLKHELQDKRKVDLIDVYSSPIAVLSVGVAFLLALKDGKISTDDPIKTILELLKMFTIVIFIVAIVILTLEIIRLLLDIRQKFIRQEAKYLFISLVGQSALLLLGALNSIYRAVNSMIGAEENTDMDQVEMKLRQKIVDKIKQQMDDDSDENYETSFSGFDEKVTKK